MSASELALRLESPLPRSLPAGRGAALFLSGSCFHPRERVAELAVVAGGARHGLAAHGMPRPDVHAGRPGPHSLRSGFWGTITLPPLAPGALELAVAARLSGGAELVAPVGRIEVAAAPAAQPERGLIAVCMATFEPDMALFRAQVESLRDQTEERWVCAISDDCSAPERFEELAAVVGDDPRFTLSRSGERLGFYRNFERALRIAPPAELVALCDQDDRWHPHKLERLRSALGGATMVYSDQRLVDADGRLLRATLWEGRANNHTDIAALLVANSVTGAATLFRREVAELALPFPDTPGMPFHDHWLGLVALAAGDVAYVDEPLYDYVQHRGAVFGAVTHGEEEPRRSGVLRGGRGAYFRGYLPRAVLAADLLARCDRRLSERKRAALRRFIAAERSPAAFAWLAGRALARRADTLGSEAELLPGIVWRWAAGPLRRDAGMPDMLAFQQQRLRRWRADVG